MDGSPSDSEASPPKQSRRREAALWLLSIVVLVGIGTTLQDELGIPFATTLRVACAGMCLSLIWNIAAEYPGERWPWISFWIAVAVNIGIFFTPLVDRPASRGELMLFAAPDATIVLALRVATYRVTDPDQHAKRLQMIAGLVLCVALCTLLFGLMLISG